MVSLLLTEAQTIDFSAFITALTTAITPAQILSVLASVIGVGVTFVLMWMGVRKAIGAFTSAVTSGRLKI